MNAHAVIVQNDESKWDDVKGDLYNYPRAYRNILTKGCKVIYYKGRMTNRIFAARRLSPEAHYFGTATVGDSIIDPDSPRQDRFCDILEYQEFEKPVPIEVNGQYLEDVSGSRQQNYWRFGVREISRDIYHKILSYATVSSYKRALPNENNEHESFDTLEGNKRVRYSSYYERNPFHRINAIEIHGLTCMACRFNFEDAYGELGKGFIHVHHNKPLSETGPTRINPRTDLSVLCANCHSMIHRNKDKTLSVEELNRLINGKLKI